MSDRLSPLSPSTRAYLLATAILVVLLGISLTFYLLGSKTSTTTVNTPPDSSDQVNTNTPQGSATIPRTASVPQEPELVESRMGKVTNIGGSSVRFQATVYSEEKSAYVLQDLTATLTSTTTYIEVDQTSPPFPSLSTSAQKNIRAIGKSDLRIGDLIDVKAGENIKDKTKFAAIEVHRILTPK
ncbi:MAG: hypothetical protein V1778_00490 [bacterium]